MKKIFLLFAFVFNIASSNSQPQNLLNNGDFNSLQSWRLNDNLRKTGKVTLLPENQGVTIYNPVIDLDGALYQEIQTNGTQWLSYSVEIKGGGMMRASLDFMALDKSGKALKIVTPTNVGTGQKWNTFSGNINVPQKTITLRVLLSVLDGSCSFAKIFLKKIDEPEKIIPRNRFVSGRGFSVNAISIERPFWELFSDDLDGDGKPEIIGCDVDGIVTVRNQGTPVFLTYAAGALVYQFEAADLNNDGVKEILMSSVDPKIPVKAINLSGNLIRVFNQSKG